MTSSPPALDAFLAQSRERIDKYLDGLLPGAGEPPAALHAAMRYAVFGGGQRLRPSLAFAAALAAGADPDRALPAAAAVELAHCFSLVHDDLPAMDNDEERRGRPTVHVAWDEATAILAGDALLVEAFAVLANEDVAAELPAALARAVGSRVLLGGQSDDLAFDAASASVATVLDVHVRKTAALFEFATWGGARLAGLDGSELAAVGTCGEAYGLAYQLCDDLRDAGTDECSVLRVADAASARRWATDQVERACEAVRPLGGAAWALVGLAEQLARRLG